MGLCFGMVLTIRTKQGTNDMYSRSILCSVDGVNYTQKWHETIYTLPVDNAKIDIISILRRCKKKLYNVKRHSVNSGKYKTRVHGYAGMTSDCTVGGLCEIFMRD